MPQLTGTGEPSTYISESGPGKEVYGCSGFLSFASQFRRHETGERGGLSRGAVELKVESLIFNVAVLNELLTRNWHNPLCPSRLPLQAKTSSLPDAHC